MSSNHFDMLTADIRARLDRQEATGWYSINCPVCNETRTRTGGFLFTDTEIHYNCFRGKCDASCAFHNGEYVSKKFKNLMRVMGIQIPVNLLVAKKKGSLQSLIEDENPLYEKHSYNNIKLPDGVVFFDKAPKSLQVASREYFESRHCTTKDTVIGVDGQYKGLFGFAMFNGNQLVGINMIPKSGGYVSIFGGNSNILYMPNRKVYDPVIVVEGGIDAKCFPNAVATLGKRITPQQAYFLKGREVIMLPDRTGGNMYLSQFHKYGWKISIPMWEEKDLNEAVLRYGQLVVARRIIDTTITDPTEAKLKAGIWGMK